MPTSTTTKTYTKTNIEQAMDAARKKVTESLSDSVFADAANLTCQLYEKNLREVLFK